MDKLGIGASKWLEWQEAKWRTDRRKRETQKTQVTKRYGNSHILKKEIHACITSQEIPAWAVYFFLLASSSSFFA